MARPNDFGGLRAGVAALIVGAVMVAFVLWLSVDEVLRTRTEEARAAGDRVEALMLARAVESLDPEIGDSSLAELVAKTGAPMAAGLYDSGGVALARAAAPGSEALLGRLPDAMASDGSKVPGVPQAGGLRDRLRTEIVELRGSRTLLVVHEQRPLAPWADTLVAYQALTLVIVIAGIAFLIWRIRRRSPVVRSAAAVTGAHPDGPAREADFVVETFQTVIGELQHKGKELELRSQRDRERADRSERFSERVIAQMPTGLVVVDRTGNVTAANPSARELFAGLPSERSEAVDYKRCFANATAISSMIADCLADGKSFHRQEIEVAGLAGDEATRCLGISVSPIAPPGGPVEASLVLMTDLTEVVELRDRIRVKETLASLGEMAAGLTHELKNSLATIQGYAQLIAGIESNRAAEPTEALVAEVRTLSQMVTDFLNFARPQDLTLAPVNVRRLVDATADRLADRMAQAGISFEVTEDSDGAECAVLGDEMLLSRALLNLFQNAIEALESVEGPRSLAVSIRGRGAAEVILEIRDNGPGIPADDAERIFIPFYTTRSRGYGIGLALTQKIIVAHGGRITVDGGLPGAAFRCRLPAASSRPQAD